MFAFARVALWVLFGIRHRYYSEESLSNWE